ncbi:MAG TPA: hypothetical protein QGG47_07720 [Acidobacteriota bacterium]|nr:hypothetical protein [Acidobacteriota bacterium]
MRVPKVPLLSIAVASVVAIVTLSGLSLTAPAHAQSETKRFLYLSTPDGAQRVGRADGAGILIYDIDNGHELVRRIDIPVFEEGLRGFAVSLINHAAYYSTTHRRVGAFDLESEEIIWEHAYPNGADRSSVTMDGSKVYVPTGWWYVGPDSGMLVLDARDGKMLNRIADTPRAHNSVVSLDGRRLYLGSETTLSIYDTADDEMLMQIPDVGEAAIFPFTINSAQTLAYICLFDHIGFDIVDLTTGKKIHRVFTNDGNILHRTHGVALTPDETELWISDQAGSKLFYYDATVMPPVQKGELELTQGGHGWVTFSLDGKYAWTHTPDVFDVATKKKVATLRDENGKPVSGSKFFEVHFRDGKVVTVSNEFGLGRKDIPAE